MKKEDAPKLTTALGGNFQDAKVIADFKERLTADGFELYVKDFFWSKELGFTTKVNWGFYDKWVDVWGKKLLSNGTVHYVAIQCKKWRNQWIHKKDVSEFWWDVEWNRKRYQKIDFFFLTTTGVTKQARKFCESRWISVSDEKILLEMHAILDIYVWIESLQKRFCDQKFRSFVKPDYFNKRRMQQIGFDREKLNVRLDSAVQTTLLKNELDAHFKQAWEELFSKGVSGVYFAETGELVANYMEGPQVVYVK